MMHLRLIVLSIYQILVSLGYCSRYGNISGHDIDVHLLDKNSTGTNEIKVSVMCVYCGVIMFEIWKESGV